MLRLPPFRYVRPSSVRDASRALADHGGHAMLLAGGTDLLPNLKRRQFDANALVAIGHLDELRGIAVNGEIELGAATRLDEISADERLAADTPGFVEAVRQIANPQIQKQGTLGGNLCVDTRCNYYNQTQEWRQSIGFCMKRDGDICLVAPGSSKCWAVSSTDAAPILMALGARVVVTGSSGERVLPLAAMYRDDGIDFLTRAPDEVLTRVLVPRMTGLRSTYRKVRRRGSFDFPILGVGVALKLAGGVVEHVRVVLGAVHTHPVEVPKIAELLEGQELSIDLIDAAADAAQRAATPLDNADLELYWRKKMTGVEVRRALRALSTG